MTSQQHTAIETRYADAPTGRVFRSARAFSPISQADAQQKAGALAQAGANAAANTANNKSPAHGQRERYPYGVRDHNLDEPEISRVTHGGALIARITRNSYGASVLNAARVMFVDVDIEPPDGNPRADHRRPASGNPATEDEALDALARVVAAQPGLAFRVYATAAGLRYLCTSRLFSPDSGESEEILKSLKSDTRYIALCRRQKCYRARLTPKPWRCFKKVALAPEERRAGAPGGFFAKLFGGGAPREKILNKPDDFATCHYVETVGASDALMLPEIAEITRLHDAHCGVTTTKPLA